MLTENNAALDAQLEQRPLAKKQEELTEHEVKEAETAIPTAAPATTENSEATETSRKSVSPKPEKVHKKALLKNDDYELDRIGKVCFEDDHI